MTTETIQTIYTFEHHYRDNSWTRKAQGSDTHVHCMGRSDDTQEHSIIYAGDTRCSCCELNIPHTTRKHDACMAWYWLNKKEGTK